MEEEKSKGDNDDGGKNSGGGAKKGKMMRGGIDRSASKGDNKDDADLWDKHAFDVGRRSEAEWETTIGKRTTKKIARSRRKRKEKRDGGSRRFRKSKIRQSEEGGEPTLARQTYQEVKHSYQTDQKGDFISKTLVDEGRGEWERSSLRFLTPIHTRIQIGV